jgi:prophage antirepressor-like protein
MSNTTHPPQPCQFHGHQLRIEMDADGEPLFHLGDLCAILDYKNPSEALRKHVDPDDLTKREGVDSLGRKNNPSNWVREPGLWSLILGSHAPNARSAKRWVTREVLPSIRRTGGYGQPDARQLQALQQELFKLKPRLVDVLNLKRMGYAHMKIARMLGCGETTIRRKATPMQSNSIRIPLP